MIWWILVAVVAVVGVGLLAVRVRGRSVGRDRVPDYTKIRETRRNVPRGGQGDG
jgi:hypothetical protein